MPTPQGAVPAGVIRRQLADGSDEHLIAEQPLVIDVAGDTVLTMRTPGDDEALAIGFLLTEGVIERADQITDVVFVPGDTDGSQPDTITLHAAIDGDGPRGILTRTHEIRSSCGCGCPSAGKHQFQSQRHHAPHHPGGGASHACRCPSCCLHQQTGH